jgi:signal transduction histidine kinase
MIANPAMDSTPSNPRRWGLERLFDAAKKDTVIRLRWPLVILSSYLLYYTPSHWLTPSQVQALLIIYLLSHTTLYFLADDLFDSPYLYAPLLLFDTLVLLVVIELGGSATPDFFVACFSTLVLSCICNDVRGLLAVTLLAPLVYACFVFNSTADFDPSVYLRLPFPFVISLFYGYFARVDRLRRNAREHAEQIKRQQIAAEEIRRQRERLEVLHQINLALTSALDGAQVLEAFLSCALTHLPYSAAVIRLRNHETGDIETAAADGVDVIRFNQAKEAIDLVDRAAAEKEPLSIASTFADPRVAGLKFFKEEGVASFLVLPLIANQIALGSVVFLSRDKHDFGPQEIDFLSTLAGQAAIAIHRAQLVDRSQQQAHQLRKAQRIKDEFLKSVSAELKAPLNVIAGYTDMFREGLLGTLIPIQEKAVETIARQAKDLYGLISSVLLVTNIEAEPLRVDLQEVNLWEFIAEVRSYYDQTVSRNRRFIWDCPADAPTVQTDRAKLKRVLENLLDNAIKFTDQGTIVFSLRLLASGQLLEFKIADSGVGIPAAQLTAIFERFHQVQSAEISAQRGGIGLGLYIVKKYVDLLGGTVRVESETGKGSAFIVQIPTTYANPNAIHERLSLPSTIA